MTIMAREHPPSDRTTPEDELRAELQGWARQLDEGKSSLDAADAARIERLTDLARACGRGSKSGAHWGDCLDSVVAFTRALSDHTQVRLTETKQALTLGALEVDFGRRLIRASCIRALETLEGLLAHDARGQVKAARRLAEIHSCAVELRRSSILAPLLDSWREIATAELQRVTAPRGALVEQPVVLPVDLAIPLLDLEKLIGTIARRLRLEPIVDWPTARADPSLVGGSAAVQPNTNRPERNERGTT